MYYAFTGLSLFNLFTPLNDSIKQKFTMRELQEWCRQALTRDVHISEYKSEKKQGICPGSMCLCQGIYSLQRGKQ